MVKLKVVKLRKTDLRKTPEELLRKLGAVNEELKRAYPQHVFLASEDYKALTKNLRKLYKKEKPFLNKRRLDAAVGMHLLDLGPSEIIGEGVRPGFALIDVEGIKANELLDRQEALKVEADEAADIARQQDEAQTTSEEAQAAPEEEAAAQVEETIAPPPPKKSLLERMFSFLGE